MFPLYDDNPTQDTSIVVYLLIVVNVLIFGYQLSLLNFQFVEWIRNWGLIPKEFVTQPLKEAITFISSQFLHGNIFHLVGNMWFLYLFGNNIEDKLGHWKFLFFYLFCGACSGFAQVITAPMSELPMVGASGAISGVMGAYLVRFPRAKIVTLLWIGFSFIPIPIRAVVFLGLWIAGQTVYAAIHNPNLPGVAYLAHVSGFMVGAITVLIYSKLMKK
ncbi:MAG: rhomboid family intramembrane serine protease [Pseudanabaena sp.]|jgi:membrane associated rhomboid family serine protease|uniref:rhomboid family intramembrane serine protease n=1 Tax=Pseudanabaena mucicola TaxID=71190 RepID=UPI002576BC49|nr:rhomboid family intramembrane serine protease [Pseudanabaena mucicola]MCA6572215.1 rhomboid family intramembrane serine protease [Pseudanabaena sp. M53BS1SP1A06MG]MCA6583166.1 rhomboid family intramembrane serine protease [Pseudanabaena sp. M34BS1SP1A06MG]MCA6586009.1 rhomboid family intramembrane serine protease [Pseudanabaena sp. M051S1SP1A06QC]MCA6590061.1 rhomboid family intramembrane serine protease [Pseudanabaena sp. M109S1SP1A06QC]MCA6592165.1 rhomboid family intramembrane serine pro